MRYVAMGSSFAAGPGLGPRAPGSPRLCFRGSESYPRRLAGLCGLDLRDVTCSGAIAQQVLRGGPLFRRPQIEALDVGTDLVTLTAGGNDVGYIGDVSKFSRRADAGPGGAALRALWRGSPRSVDERPFAALGRVLIEILAAIRRRAPRASVVVVTYPAVLPPAGSCPELGLSEPDATLLRAVAARLAEVTRECALIGGARIVDMALLSLGHDACAAEPWVNGRDRAKGAPFHPTVAGAEATAHAIARAIGIG